MTNAEHERARMLIALSGPEGETGEEQAWLNAHLDSCAACRQFAGMLPVVAGSMRAMNSTASATQVTATKMRLRQRAVELEAARERIWVVIACAMAVTLASAVSMAALWGGMSWIGHQAHLQSLLWKTTAAISGCLPAMFAAVLLLAKGSYLVDRGDSRAN